MSSSAENLKPRQLPKLRYGTEELLDVFRAMQESGCFGLSDDDPFRAIAEVFRSDGSTREPLSLEPISDEEQRSLSSFIHYQQNRESSDQSSSGTVYRPTSHVYRPPFTGQQTRPPRSSDVTGSSPSSTVTSGGGGGGRTFIPSSNRGGVGRGGRWKRGEEVRVTDEQPQLRQISRSIMSKNQPATTSSSATSIANAASEQTDLSVADLLYGNPSNIEGGPLPEWVTNDDNEFDVNAMTFDQNGVYVRRSMGDAIGNEENNRTSETINALQNLNIEDVRSIEDGPLSPRMAPPPQQAPAPPSQSTQPQRNHWFYIDPQGKIRGDFGSEQMSQWYNAGYFSLDILIKRQSDTQFHKLSEYLQWLGPNFLFSTRPEPDAVPQRQPHSVQSITQYYANPEDLTQQMGFHDPSIMAASRQRQDGAWTNQAGQTAAARRLRPMRPQFFHIHPSQRPSPRIMSYPAGHRAPVTRLPRPQAPNYYEPHYSQHDQSATSIGDVFDIDLSNGATFTRSRTSRPQPPTHQWRHRDEGTRNSVNDVARIHPRLLSRDDEEWATVQLRSMYGPRVNSDGLIHILQQFTTHNEMENFVTQMHGVHPNASQFISEFLDRMMEAIPNGYPAVRSGPSAPPPSEA
ncbi:hypothetical protein ACOME3_003810 [Neoechinorhynchus agilis]